MKRHLPSLLFLINTYSFAQTWIPIGQLTNGNKVSLASVENINTGIYNIWMKVEYTPINLFKDKHENWVSKGNGIAIWNLNIYCNSKEFKVKKYFKYDKTGNLLDYDHRNGSLSDIFSGTCTSGVYKYICFNNEETEQYAEAD